MVGHELAIEQGEIADLQPRDEPGQRDLRRVPAAAEHAFTEKSPAELHAVNSAGEIAAVPNLDRMGVAGAVEREHGALELGVDPGPLALGAAGDHAGEITVVSDVEPAEADRTTERARKMK